MKTACPGWGRRERLFNLHSESEFQEQERVCGIHFAVFVDVGKLLLFFREFVGAKNRLIDLDNVHDVYSAGAVEVAHNSGCGGIGGSCFADGFKLIAALFSIFLYRGTLIAVDGARVAESTKFIRPAIVDGRGEKLNLAVRIQEGNIL